MSFTEIREELLAQHEQLDELGAIAAALGKRFLVDNSVELKFIAAVDALAAAFAHHNTYELMALAPLFANIADTGPLLVRRMLDEHVAEHALFKQSLTGSPLELATRIGEVVELMMAHMMAEERTFLNPGATRGPPLPSLD